MPPAMTCTGASPAVGSGAAVSSMAENPSDQTDFTVISLMSFQPPPTQRDVFSWRNLNLRPYSP